MLAEWLGDHLGIVGNALHATATNRSDARPSVPLVVSPSLDAWGGGAETL